MTTITAEMAKQIGESVAQAIAPLYDRVAALSGSQPVEQPEPTPPTQQFAPGTVGLYEAQIAELDKEREAELATQAEPTGNQSEVFTTVSNRIAASAKYDRDRATLQKLASEAGEVSSGVAAFLKNETVPGKLDVIEGRAKPTDTGFNPSMQGKQI